MRSVDSQMIENKIDEAVSHYMTSENNEVNPVSVDPGSLAFNIQEDAAGRVVTVMQSQGYPSQMCRQDQAAEGGQWHEELLDPEGRLAAFVAHLAQQTRVLHHYKGMPVRSEVDSSVILDTPIRLFNSGQQLEQPPESLVVQVPQLPLPQLEMKRCNDPHWFSGKSKEPSKENGPLLVEPEILEASSAAAVSSPAPSRHSKKSLPHKKRISKKLKRSTVTNTPQQPMMMMSDEDINQEEILPDNFVNSVPHHIPETHHISHQVRPIFICQVCGEFYGEEQLKFFHHLKEHYEPQETIIIENPVIDVPIDKMTNSCIVDNVSALPDSLVELSLENSIPKTMYQQIDKHILYTSSDKTVYNKVSYPIENENKESTVPNSESEKTDLYDIGKMELYNCVKCPKSNKRVKCDENVKSQTEHNPKLEEDMGEFSEPEDLMDGIHVAVEDNCDHYDHLLPHLTVENGQIHQEQARHWFLRGGMSGGGVLCAGEAGAGAAEAGGAPDDYCPVCLPPRPSPGAPQPTHPLKEEVLQKILDSEVRTEGSQSNVPQESTQPPDKDLPPTNATKAKKGSKKNPITMFVCSQCNKVFYHRSSLFYHALSHKEKKHHCKECGKAFYTPAALQIHSRVHTGDRPHKCEECGRAFRQWGDLNYHKISKHTTEKSHKCGACGKAFARKYSLRLHEKTHTGEKTHRCDHCPMMFRTNSYKQMHMRKHTGYKPHKCEQCGKGFRGAPDLRRHMTTHDKLRCKIKSESATPFKAKITNISFNIVNKIKDKIEVVKEETNVEAMLEHAKKPRVALLKKFDARSTKITKSDMNAIQLENIELNQEYDSKIVSYGEEVADKVGKKLKDHSQPSSYDNHDKKYQGYLRSVKSVSNVVLNDQVRIDKDGKQSNNDVSGEVVENGFIKGLTALYNIATV